MTTDIPPETKAALETDLHGESLGTDAGVFCDFCTQSIDTSGSVLYEVLHLVDLANIQNALGMPDMWILDGARCDNCAIDQIEPATDGIEEALVRLSIAEAHGVFSADTSGLEVVSFVPGEEGYYPPLVALDTVLEQSDLGLTRWHRLRLLLELAGNENPHLSTIYECIKYSLDVPPSVAELCP